MSPPPISNIDEFTDRMVQWCREHNITTKGHPLAWNYVDPKWLPNDPTKAMELQIQRIDRTVKRFDPAILYWDVVNEATHYDRPEILRQAPKLTEAIRQIGVPAYIKQAFAAARKANPKANLIINDYRTDPEYDKLVISKLVDDSGKPMYDIIGIQSHMHGGYWGAETTWKTCEYFAKVQKTAPLYRVDDRLRPQDRQGLEHHARRRGRPGPRCRRVLHHPVLPPVRRSDHLVGFLRSGRLAAGPRGFPAKGHVPQARL